MALTCREILQHTSFSGLFKLLAGKSNIDNTIMWFFIASDVLSRPALTMPGSGELVFVPRSFAEAPIISQLEYIDDCIRRQVPAMVIMGSIEHTESAELMIEYAEKTGFPLMCMENPMEVVGVTKKLAYLIMQEDSRDDRTRDFMKFILGDDEISLPVIMRRGFLCGINLENPCVFVSLGCNYEDKSENAVLDDIIRFRDNEGYISLEIKRICTEGGFKILSYTNEWQSMCLIELREKSDFAQLRKGLDEFLTAYRKSNGIPIIAGYSDVCENAEGIKLFYRQSERALKFISNSRLPDVSISFEELGVMRFAAYLSEAEKCALIDYAKSQLRPLAEYDKNNGTDYLHTYSVFLHSDGTLQDIADRLYIHRNTLIKRLNQIQRLLGKDINSIAVKNEGINIFFIFDYFGVKY